MIAGSSAYIFKGHNQPMFGPIGISLAAHLLLAVFVVFTPSWNSDPEYLPSVIDVQMVDLSDLSPASAPAQKEAPPKEKAPVVKEKKTEPDPVPKATVESSKEPEVSVAPTKKTTKIGLKYKTFKTQKVLKNVIKRVEKKVDKTAYKPLQDTLKKIRDKVSKEGRPGPASDNAPQGEKTDKSGIYGKGSKKEIDLIDLYRIEIAHTIQKNWAFAAQLSGNGQKMMAKIAFKVMPNGEITDIFFTDRSGSQYLDDSAYRAIKKSSPVRPHPEKLSRPYIEVGLRFTPEGVQ